jgi:hypothetical protein
MVRMRDLVMVSMPPLQVLREDDTAVQDVPGTTPPVDNAKALLLNVAKQSAELYNILGDGESIAPELQDKLTQIAALTNDIFMSVQYEKKADSAKSLGNGDGTPAVQGEATNPQLDAADSEVKDAKQDWIDSIASREKAESDAAEERQDYTSKLNGFLDKKKKLKQ